MNSTHSKNVKINKIDVSLFVDDVCIWYSDVYWQKDAMGTIQLSDLQQIFTDLLKCDFNKFNLFLKQL